MIEQYYISAIVAFGLFVTFMFVMYRIQSRLEQVIIASILILSSLVIYRHIDDYGGKPTMMSEPVEKAWVLGFHADIPNGALYLWLRLPESGYPVSYRVPYSPKMHGNLDRLRAKHKGKPYMAKIKGRTSITKPYSQGGVPGLLEIPKILPLKESR